MGALVPWINAVSLKLVRFIATPVAGEFPCWQASLHETRNIATADKRSFIVLELLLAAGCLSPGFHNRYSFSLRCAAVHCEPSAAHRQGQLSSQLLEGELNIWCSALDKAK